MKRNILILIFTMITLPHALTSQIESRKAFEFSVSTLPPLYDKSNYRIGFNYLYKRWHFGIDAGYGNYSLNKYRLRYSPWGEEYRHWSIRPHLFYSYKVSNEGLKRVFSLGIELFFKDTKDHFENRYYEVLETGDQFTFDNAWYQDRQTGIHLAHLGRLQISNRFSIESIIGIGVAYRNIQYSSIQNPRPSERYEEGFLFFGNSRITQGKRWVGRLRLGFDFTYRLF